MTHPGRRGHGDAKRAVVYEAWLGPLTTREIAEACGLSLRTVWRWSRDWPPRKLGRRPE